MPSTWPPDPPTAVVVLGAGGFGRGVLDVVDALRRAGHEIRVTGFLDPDVGALPPTERDGARVIGVDDDLAHMEVDYVVGIGSGAVRAALDRLASSFGRRAATLVHPAASVGGDTSLAGGVVLTAGSRVASNVWLGRHVHVNLNATIGHDARLGDYVTVFPQAAVSGGAVVEEAATLGTGSAVLPGRRIGARATVGAGAVVVRDVAPGATVVGVPARPLAAPVRPGGSR